MALQIHVLDYGDIELETSFLVLGHECGRTRRVPVYGFLITGGAYPIVVDTGYRDNAIMESLGMRGLQFHDNMIENQLAKHGLKMGDIRYVLHTHLHIDHAGKDDLFPMNTTVVLNRRELEFSVSGIMYPQYPKPDILHLVERVYEDDAMRFLDLELTGAEEIMPGVWCEPAGAHTEGSMNVIVETAEGLACICGDVVYDFNDQIVKHVRVNNYMEPQVTGNHSGSKRAEKAAFKKLMNNYTFVLPTHDKGAKVEHGQVVGRTGMVVPGPLTETLPKREWFPM
ncbi:N-acyl homoserine lactonase family protein [Yoonia sp. SS1-5]|uniref:N-acyl homoserine lactonase family protein n=1 Tax=Yoonia rhodophyticola TaxID=3137370 RepID=A0AAN0M6T6_9RHOB